MTHTLYILSTAVHVIAAVTWVGGLIFMSLMLVPALRSMGNPALTARLIQAVGNRFKVIGWTCLGLLTVTGFTNLSLRGYSHGDLVSAAFWQTQYGETLAWKLTLFAGIVGLSLLHDLLAGPRLRQLRESNPARAENFRVLASWMGRITAVLSILVTLLAIMLVRGRPW